jgi:hypothetical protein
MALHFAAECVRKIRDCWSVPAHKELWFRGEREDYDTRLRPMLYRRKDKCLKPTAELLKIEHDLYENFQRYCELTEGSDLIVGHRGNTGKLTASEVIC